MPSKIFIEHLTLFIWFFQMMPKIFVKRGLKFYVVDSTRGTFWFCKLIAKCFGSTVMQFHFRLIDVRDDKGLLIRLRIEYDDLGKFQDLIFRKYIMLQCFETPDELSEFQTFIRKGLADAYIWDHKKLWRALLLIQIAAWKIRAESYRTNDAVLYLDRRPWMEELVQYGKQFGVAIRRLSQQKRSLLKVRAKNSWLVKALYGKLQLLLYIIRTGRDEKNVLLENKLKTPLIAVECCDFFNLNSPELYSDFFFLDESSLKAENLLALFNVPINPLDQEKFAKLQERGIRALSMNPKAAKTPKSLYGPIVPRLHRIPKDTFRYFNGNKMEKKMLKVFVNEYNEYFSLWRKLFHDREIRIYLSWTRYFGTHCAVADAIRDAGGVMAIYQRALDVFPSISLSTQADVVFGFSDFCGKIEGSSQSCIGHYVITGYFGDHRFPLLRPRANQLRSKMKSLGATRIISYSDEGSHDDSRWHTGHDYVRENYTFLLEKVLGESWFGLVLKPKNPTTLRQRLGPVAPLLERALRTGRCFLYEGGTTHGHFPPAAAGLSADVAIHGYLCGPTAGLECALAGIPTLLMDREGWHISPLYQLGVGKVVFKDWDSLWRACLVHWKNPESLSGFGDWSPMIDRFDPFRDGKGAHRVGNYLKWLVEGFEKGESRENVLLQATEKYQKQWGHDKVLSLQ